MSKYFKLLFATPVKQAWTYKGDEKGEAAVGKRAIAPFGRREETGYIIAESESPPPNLKDEQIKSIRRVVDKTPLFGEREIALCRWLSQFYLCSGGEAISAMIPSGRRASQFSAFSADDFESEELFTAGVTLSSGQEAALKAILAGSAEEADSGDGPGAGGGAVGSGGKNAHFYLYGITGSGKTEVFLRAAEYMLNRGKSVIYLVPEISLTHQTAEVIGRRFGSRAATLHSGMSGSERLFEWMRILRGEARIVVGPRSAVFSPVRDLALIIIDEEHDGSFKSSSAPRYHGRQVAMRRCADEGALLIMGSATPSAEAWHLMRQGRIKRLDLTERLSGGAPPKIKPVNFEHAEGCLTTELREEIRRTALAGRQSILFLNRRGFAYFYHCKDCGYELICKRCSVSLTWHKARGRAVCHYCGYEAPPPAACPQCGSLEAGFIGIGTEMVEEELKRSFPELRIRRVDADTVEKKGGLEEALGLFRAGSIDILLGTQMVAKGLNFPGVRLVGVVFADTGLHLPDFRAAERTFSLIVQVAGRAGRFFPDGKVLVQTLRPFDPVIQAACALDVEGFFAGELENRKLQGFPPFSRLIRIVARGRDYGRVAEAIGRFFSFAVQALPRGADILGPADCPISLLAGNYRRHILLRSPDMARLHDAVRRALLFYEQGKDAKVYLEVDVDPTQLL